MEEILTATANYGFPMVVAAYLLIRHGTQNGFTEVRSN